MGSTWAEDTALLHSDRGALEVDRYFGDGLLGQVDRHEVDVPVLVAEGMTLDDASHGRQGVSVLDLEVDDCVGACLGMQRDREIVRVDCYRHGLVDVAAVDDGRDETLASDATRLP